MEIRAPEALPENMFVVSGNLFSNIRVCIPGGGNLIAVYGLADGGL